LRYCKTYVNLIIPIQTSANAKSLVKISLVLAEIFGGICRFLPCRSKRCSCYPRNLWGYWTNLVQILFAHDIATILPLNIFESELPYSYPFRNASLPNEGHFANVVQNWLPWQRFLRNRTNRSSSIYEQIIGLRTNIKIKLKLIDCLRAKVKVDPHTKNQGKRSNGSNRRAPTDKRTDKHTHGRYQTYYRPCYAVDKN